MQRKSPSPDREARLTRLMEEHGTQVLRVCRLYLHDGALAQDAAQESFLRLWRALDSVRTGGERAYLMRIAANVCKNLLRSREQRAFRNPVPEYLSEPGGEDRYSDDTVLRAVESLPVKYRECVILHYYQEFSVEETARILRLPRPTVSTRLRRGREQLRSLLKGWYFDEEDA